MEFWRLKRLNRTSVGLKHQNAQRPEGRCKRLNRTSVGLKRGCATSSGSKPLCASIEPAWD